MILRGDAREIGLAKGSVHCVMTSPPYWGLRDYGTGTWVGGWTTCDHLAPYGQRNDVDRVYGVKQGLKTRQFNKVCGKCGARRVDRQIGLEATPEDYVQNLVEVFHEVYRVLRDDGTLWLNVGDTYAKNKELVGLPWKLALALQADGWYLRTDIIWHKPSTMPDAATDRPSRNHEYVFLLSKGPKYFYDEFAVRESGALAFNPDRNRRSVWTITNEQYAEAHFATFPQKLVEPCIMAGTSEKGCCTTCGMPWVRRTQRVGLPPSGPLGVSVTHLGWEPGCSHNAGVTPCVVLDPFLGSGTVGQVAERLGRRWVGVEYNPNYLKLASRRTAQLGLFAQVRLNVEAGAGNEQESDGLGVGTEGSKRDRKASLTLIG